VQRYTGVATASRSRRPIEGSSFTRMLNAGKRCVFLTQPPGPLAATTRKRVLVSHPYARGMEGFCQVLPPPDASRSSASVPDPAHDCASSAREQPKARWEVWNDFGVARRHEQKRHEHGFSGRRPRGPNMRSSCRGTASTRGGAYCRQDRANQLRCACASPVPPADSSLCLPVPPRRRLVPPSGG
jgi:hypothetical protein